MIDNKKKISETIANIITIHIFYSFHKIEKNVYFYFLNNEVDILCANLLTTSQHNFEINIS